VGDYLYASARNSHSIPSFKSQLSFDEFRDILTSKEASDKFRLLIRGIRRKIAHNRIETLDDMIYLPHSLSKMISYMLERTKTQLLRDEVVVTIKNLQEATKF
jgi:hypothetical protein